MRGGSVGRGPDGVESGKTRTRGWDGSKQGKIYMGTDRRRDDKASPTTPNINLCKN